MKKYILMFLAGCMAFAQTWAQQTISGKITASDTQHPIPGASVRVKGTNRGTKTDNMGAFAISVGHADTLAVSFVGYNTQFFAPPFSAVLNITMQLSDAKLEEVVVSTGYQTLPKERVVGSFTVVDQQLLNRSVSTNLLDRLRDVVPGFSFNNVGSSSMSIRGQSTIYGNAEPLIVLDNFPFEGSMQDINPNDVESITILRDAAAASIWGARAGNGVIVITTKKGKLNQALQVSLNSNFTMVDVPDLYAGNKLSASDYIDIEKKLFSQGYYDASQATGYEALTPVVEMLYKKKADPSLATEVDAEMERLKGLDVRRDFSRYIYRKGINQQQALNLKGGGGKNSYYLSLGYDHNRGDMVGNELSRVSVAGNNTFKFLKDRLELATAGNFSVHTTVNNAVGTNLSNASAGGVIYPYAQLADEQGNHLPIIKNYRSSFISQASSNGLLDWSYVPLDEPDLVDMSTKRRTARLSGSLAYHLWKGLKASVRYQFINMETTGRNERSLESYYSRDLINRFTQVSGTTLVRPVPLGGILDFSQQSMTDHGFRTQLDFNRNWKEKHELTAMAGIEIRSTRTESANHRYYGYDSEYAQNTFVDYTNNALPFYYDSSRKGQIPFADALGLYNDRFRSYYANISYGFLSRYIFNASARLDQSNLFGVKTNQKGVPLWSMGIAWNVDKENFYFLKSVLPYLKVRTTYGYNGNVDKTVSAYTTAAFAGNRYNMPYATIINPPNPNLKWERVAIWNVGLDFGFKGNRISGSAEYYHKKGMDLIGDMPMPASSGVLQYRGNIASTTGSGIELAIRTQNLQGKLKWQSDFVFANQKENITDYFVTATSSQYLQSGLYLPLKGKPLYSLYSYSWAGLDPDTGDPQGYLNGVASKDYTAIIREYTPEKLIFNGSIRPTTFGSLRNTISYGDISFSFNIAYRLGYVFRKNALVYGANLGLLSNNGDYAVRWQNPGDEVHTQVPSVPAAANNNRDMFYRYSDVLVDKADNIRLQDIRFDYMLSDRNWLPFQQVQFYVYSANLGILWKRTRFDVDPDIQYGNYPVSIAFGIKVNFK